MRRKLIGSLVAVVIGPLMLMTNSMWAGEPSHDIKQPDSNLTVLEKLYYKNEIREQDFPRLETPIREDSAVVADNHCIGEWFHFEKEKFMISRASCNDARLAYTVLRIANDKKMTFIVGFYDFDGDGIFTRVNDMHDRPLPEWIKARSKAKDVSGK